LYVDNILSSVETEEDVMNYFSESRSLMSKVGFNLRSWTSNSQRLQDIAKTQGVHDSDNPVKVLGMRWDPELDTMEFCQRRLQTTANPTKRFILQESSKIFDPLGLLSPVTVRAKLLIQDLWKEQHTWDTPLPDSIKQKWSSIANDLNKTVGKSFPRQYFPQMNQARNIDDITLHVFVDASERSYGAVAYLCHRDQTSLVMAKNRISPLKTITLPRLELMAAVIGARLASHIQTSLDITTIQFWSDSQIVLHWLKSTKPLKRFVLNRVKEIQELTVGSKWSYCPTGENPADLLTRGLSAEKFGDSKLWRNGPSWLSECFKWPQITLNVHIPDEEADDIVVTVSTADDSSTSGSDPSNGNSIHTIVDATTYSSYKKLLRVTVYVNRFISNCKTPSRARETGALSVTELRQAELLWILNTQSNSLKDEKDAIRSKSSKISTVRQLRLFLDDDNAIRCGGRIHNAPIDEDAKFPYLLPKNHVITRLIVRDAHLEQLHSGVNATVTHLRQKFWIPCIRQITKSVIHKCVICRKVTSRPFNSPDSPPLPKCRLSDSPPFTVTGVDFSGALYVKNDVGQEKKVYVCLFTCASTRAVHLEIVSDLTEDAFMQAFRRFTSRRSLPALMLSDNASTYMAAANYLKRFFYSPTVRTALTQRGVQWMYIPKRAPWYGGFWERLIGLTKTALKKILGRAYVSMETLQTILTEVEAIMNDRPLTHVSSNVSDPEPLTPSHLLYGRRLIALPNPIDSADDVPQLTKSTARRQLNTVHEFLNTFWRRWRCEYLTALREHHAASGSTQQTIKIGDVVQIHDDTPRSRWKLAVIEELITGNDGRTRAAKLRTSNGLTNRPIVKLYPLEVV